MCSRDLRTGRVLIFTVDALAPGGTGEKQVSNIQIPKGHTHAPHTANESHITRAPQSGQGDPDNPTQNFVIKVYPARPANNWKAQ